MSARLAQLVQEAVVLCGAGSADMLAAVCRREPDERLWALALDAYRQRPPYTVTARGHVNYLVTLIRRARRELDTAAGAAGVAELPLFLRGDYGRFIRT